MMCTVCGCGEGETRIEGQDHEHEPHHPHEPDHGHHHDYGQGPAHAHAPGISQARMVQIEQDILGKNDEYARANRQRFARDGMLVLNLVSSPGSGKTSLLTATLQALKDEMPLAVIEGDQQTRNDAERIRATGVPALQINTGKGCHLDAHQVGHAVDHLAPQPGTLLFIENVGNLVCPAAFDLGEAHKIAILSVTEGEDKPIKYPDMFAAADLLLISKTDLMPHLDFDLERCIDYALQVNPGVQILSLSAQSGEGMSDWLDWLRLARQSRMIGWRDRPVARESA